MALSIISTLASVVAAIMIYELSIFLKQPKFEALNKIYENLSYDFERKTQHCQRMDRSRH